MTKTLAQVLLSLCLFFAVINFPQKIGLLFAGLVKAAWNLVITAGRNVPIPGEKKTGTVKMSDLKAFSAAGLGSNSKN